MEYGMCYLPSWTHISSKQCDPQPQSERKLLAAAVHKKDINNLSSSKEGQVLAAASLPLFNSQGRWLKMIQGEFCPGKSQSKVEDLKRIRAYLFTTNFAVH